MKSLLAAIALLLAAAPLYAAPFDKGDPKIGKMLVDKSCVSCHASMVGGDGSKIYTRADRKVKNAQQLAARVAACNANTGANWLPQDEMHVEAYLNQQYYKFK
ncbi:MAG TPA: cytochrome c [Sulfuriferula sp.]|nr:cytochrome c [Sulfuriferula sp.]